MISRQPPSFPLPIPLDDQLRVLSDENRRLREAGAQMAVAALRVATEYDGVHRLMLAVSVWAKAMADEHGRGEVKSDV
jgi:hypothetical protein